VEAIMSAKSALMLVAVVVIVVLVVVIPKSASKSAGNTSSSATQPAEAKPAKAEITLTYANFPPAPTFPCVQMER
jgi:hypothetical protein